MRIFIVSSRGDSIGLAKKLKSENNEVNFYVKDRRYREILDDEMPVVTNPTGEMMNAELIIVEDYESGKFADKARKLKRLVIGGGSLADRLAKDVSFNEDSARGCGLELARERTEGIVVEVGSWFNGKEFLRPHFIGFKYYRFGSGDIGPFTRGSGIVGFYKIKSGLFNKALKPIGTLLKTSNYIGYASVEGFINNAHFHAIKIHAGFLYPTVNLITELHSTWSSFLTKLAKGEAEVTAVQPNKIGIGVSYFPPIFFREFNPFESKLFHGIGDTIEEAKIRVYRLLNKSNLPKEGYYRIDIGDNFEENMKKLNYWGWV